MSGAATIPFQNRRGFFPFCPAALPDLSSSGYDHLDITFAQAMQLYWLIEGVHLEPVATEAVGGGAPHAAFTKTFTSPLPDLVDLYSFDVKGSVVYGRSGPDESQAAGEPAWRVCVGHPSGALAGATIDTIVEYRYSDGGFPPGFFSESVQLVLALGYSAGTWRLFYKLLIVGRSVIFRNPGAGVLPYSPGSGSFFLGDFELQYVYGSNISTVMVTDAAMTGTLEYLTPPP